MVDEFKEFGKYVNMEEIDELALVSKKKTSKLTKLMTMQVEVRKRRKEDENKERLQRRILLKELRTEIKLLSNLYPFLQPGELLDGDAEPAVVEHDDFWIAGFRLNFASASRI